MVFWKNRKAKKLRKKKIKDLDELSLDNELVNAINLNDWLRRYDDPVHLDYYT